MRYTKETVINAPAEKVYAYLADLSRHTEWASHPLKLEPASPGAFTAVGSTFASVGHQFGRDNTETVTVRELVPNQSIIYESNGKGGLTRHTFALIAANGGTRLSKSMESVSWPAFTKLLTPFFMIALPAAMATDLKRIKAKLE